MRLSRKAKLFSTASFSSFVVLSSATFAVTPAIAQSVWTGTGSSDWFDSVNWQDGAVPDSQDSVSIDTSLPYPVVISGSVASSLLVDIGVSNPTAAGVVTVTGSSSRWEITNQLNVGNLGSGKLAIEDGAAVNSNEGALGLFESGEGTVEVSGMGSSWTMNGDLYIGREGSGTLTIAGSGVASSMRGVVGYFAGSMGTVTVTGQNSSWTINDILQVGRAGTGELLIADGGSIRSGYGSVGSETSNAAGNATVTGRGSSWIIDDMLYVGRFGNGDLLVAEGGVVSSGFGRIGEGSNSNGIAVIDGPNARWENAGELVVGVAGSASLIVKNGGVLSAHSITVAQLGWGTGTLAIGADADSPAAAPGTVDSSTITLGNGNGTIVFNHTANDYVFAPAISGNGTVNTVSGRTSLTGANTYTGGTTISGGTVVANHETDGVIDALGTGLITLSGGRLHSALGSSTINSYLVAAGKTGTISTATGTELWLNGGSGQEFSLQGNLVIGAVDGAGDVIMDVIGTPTAQDATITVAFGRLIDGNSSLGILTSIAGATRVATGATIDFSGHGGAIRNLQDATPGNGGTVSWGNDLLRVYGGSFSGQFVNSLGGELVKVSTDTLLLNGNNSSFTGTTTVADGKLIVGDVNNSSAVLGGNISVLSGATLGGYGSVGETTAQSGGILSPGNSIGTLTIDGNLTLAPGSVLEIEIAGNGTSDRVDVAGTATVSGSNVSVKTIDPETSYQNGQLYHILTADGGISGEFAGVVSNSAFLDMSLAYDDTAADLKICLKTGCPAPVDPGTSEPEQPSPALFTTVAQTRNQLATAGGLDTLAQTGSSLTLYNTLLMLSADEARAAFDSLSGEAYASAKGVLINDSQFIRNAALGRLQQAFGGTPATPINALSYAGSQRHVSASASAIDTVAPASIAPVQNLYAAWGYAYGAWTRQDGNGNAGAVKSSVGGFVTGIDGTVLDTWRLGLLAGYSHSSFDVDDRASSGSSDNYTLGAYAGTEWTLNNGHALAFRSGLAYTWHNVDMNRSVAFPGFADNLTGDYDAGSFQVFGELGYKIHSGKALFEPYAGLAYVRLKTDGFDEKGQTAAALSVQSGTTDTSFSTLGFRASTEFVLGSVTATARTDLGWRHAYGDITPVSTASFIGSDAFTVSGLPIAEDAALIEAGLDFKLTEDATLGISYNGQFASGAKQNGFNAKLSVGF
ncbi:autotransporter domain-containing protein [Brucella pituitosa]|uniref:autotransporter outer membrane beta-barrel domain-containing protein n=1 Tax=Brucella pituitosa TaxID=571256 RepID=UPI003F4ADEB3